MHSVSQFITSNMNSQQLPPPAFFLAELERRCLEIVDELKQYAVGSQGSLERQRYVSCHEVVSVLLNRYRVHSLQQLGLYDLIHIPLLDYLLDMNRRVDVFVSTYIATHDILCYADLHQDLVMSLKSFSIPTFHQVAKNVYGTTSNLRKNVKVDPCEIDIDSPTESSQTVESVTTLNYFDDYGLGDLSTHPLVISIFGSNLPSLTHYYNMQQSPNTTESPASTIALAHQQDVLWHLKEYLLTCEPNAHTHQMNLLVHSNQQYHTISFQVDDFTAHLLNEVYSDAETLLDVGLIIQGDLQRQVSLMKEIVRSQRQVEAELLREELSALQTHRNGLIGSPLNENPKNANKKIVRCLPVLQPPKNNPRLLSLLERSKATVMKNGDQSFAPSLKKIRDALTAMLHSSDMMSEAEETTDIDGEADVMPLQRPKKKQKRQQQQQQGNRQLSKNSQAIEVMLEAATEYIFLHLGSKKDVAKRFEQEEEEEESEAEDESIVQDKQEKETISISESDIKDQTIIDSRDETRNTDEAGDAICLEGPAETETISGIHSAVTPAGDTNRQHRRSAPQTVTASSQKTSLQRSSTDWEVDLKMTISLPTMAIDDATVSSLIEVIPGEKLLPFTEQIKHLLQPQMKTTDTKAIGRFGEALVYQYLQSTLSLTETESIKWLNEDDETKASYDLILTSSSSVPSTQGTTRKKTSTTFIEVKSTRFPDRNVFDLSWWEWTFATSLPKVNFHIYRVYGISPSVAGVGSNSMSFDPMKLKIVVIKDIEELVKLGRIKLCLAI